MSHVAQKQDVLRPRGDAALSPSASAASGAWSRSIFSPWRTCAAPAPRCGTAGRRSCSRISSAPRAASSPAQPLARDAALAEKQAEATRLLRLYALSDGSRTLLEAARHRLLLRHEPQEIAGHTRSLHYRVGAGQPWSRRGFAPFGEGLQVMIYMPDREALFARICGYFERAGFNIAEAKIHTTRDGYALDTFVVMGQGSGAHYRDMISLIESELAGELESQAPLVPRRGGRVSGACATSRSRPPSTSAPTSAARSTPDHRRRATGPASLRRRAHAGALPHQPSDRAHQHAGRPRRGRVPRLRRGAVQLRRPCCSSSRTS
jgi:hypothetical protein